MSGSTDRLGLYLAGGGSSEEFDDEVIDIDRQNTNFETIDATVGAPGYTSTSRPATPYDGQLIWETDTEKLVRWDAGGSEWADAFVVAQATPVGVISDFAGSTAPDGWLICDGSTKSRTTYAGLFAVIGETYGAGDGSTTFALPNLKGRASVGMDASQTEFDALGETGGAKTHTLTIAQMPSHNHPGNHRYVSRQNHSSGSIDVRVAALENGLGPSVNGAHAQGGGDAHNNLQPYLVLNKIIKS